MKAEERVAINNKSMELSLFWVVPHKNVIIELEQRHKSIPFAIALIKLRLLLNFTNALITENMIMADA